MAINALSRKGGADAFDDPSDMLTVSSPDIGCRAYADWWEVESEEGELLARRALPHSHVDEQAFTRSGGPLNVQPDEELSSVPT